MGQGNDGGHYHCPHDCEHPQPWEHEGELICGRCAAIDGMRAPMILCTPKVCPSETQ